MAMITVDLARRLAAAGLAWTPEPGDRFAIPDLDFDGEVFVISQMTIDVERYPTDVLLKFNGTTEWALDSISQEQGLWLPREDQLRARLGERFVGLSREPVDGELTGFVVTVRDPADRVVDADAECAYARALLTVLERT